MATPSKANATLMWHKKKPVIRFMTAYLRTLSIKRNKPVLPGPTQ